MSRSEGARLIRVGVIAFAVFVAALLLAALWLGPPVRDTDRFPISEVGVPDAAGIATVTLDARDHEAWVPFSFELGRVVPQGAAADVLVRRQLVRTARGAADLGAVPLSEARLPADVAWTTDDDGADPPTNPVLTRWYEYSYLTHLLEPKDHTYAVRLAEGVAFVQVVGYYCVPDGGGCLTLRYRVE